MSQHSSRSGDWKRIRLAVLERDHWLCQICRSRQATEVDHIVPRSKGGTDDMANLQAACDPCNRAKSDKQIVRATWRNPKWFPSAS